MQIEELQPLLTKVAILRGNPSASVVLEYVEQAVARARTSSMAQSVCDQIISMCNPKAWGDLNVAGFGRSWSDWHAFLSELSELAESCGQAIYDHNRRAIGK